MMKILAAAAVFATAVSTPTTADEQGARSIIELSQAQLDSVVGGMQTQPYDWLVHLDRELSLSGSSTARIELVP